MSTATFVTSQGTFKVKLMPEHAHHGSPTSSTSRQARGSGKTPVTQAQDRAPLQGDGLPPRHPRLHDPGRDPRRDRRGGPGYQFEDEFPPGGRARPPLPPRDGQRRAVATNDSPVLSSPSAPPLTSTTGTHDLRGGHRGPDVIDTIANVPTGAQDRPREDVVLQEVTIDEG